jgi:hypothetical protein
MIVVVSLLVSLLVLAGGGVLAWRGFRQGDRPDDARARVRLAWTDVDGHLTLAARAEVSNPSDRPVVVSAEAARGRWLGLRARGALSWPGVVPPSGRAGRVSRNCDGILGAVDAWSRQMWAVGLVGAGRRARITVRFHQGVGRVRVLTFRLPVPAAPPTGRSTTPACW